MNKKDPFDTVLDEYEQEIEDSLPDDLNAPLPVVANLAEEQAKAKIAAANYFRKEAKMNIRLTRFDAEGIRRIAAREGLPYQTLIASILHKYVTQHLPA
jgi:predicted DNA binding CopG/RHH family protein